MEYFTCHLYFLGIQTRLKAGVDTKKIQMTRGIPLESVAYKLVWFLLKICVSVGGSLLEKQFSCNNFTNS